MPPLTPFASRRQPIGLMFPQDIYKPYFKVEIVDKNNTTTTYQSDSNDRIISFTIRGRVNGLKTATILIDNAGGVWTNRFLGGESITIYADYTNTLGSSEKIFKGRLDEYTPSLEGGHFSMELIARQTPQLADKVFTASFTNTEAGSAISSIINDNYSGVVTTASIPNTTLTINLNFINSKGISGFTKICESVGYDWYVDESDAIQVVAKGSVKNNNENASFGVNVVNARNRRDFREIKNRVFAYGSNAKGVTNIFYLQMRENEASQNQSWIKDDIINSSEIKTNENAATFATNGLITTASNKASITVAGGLLTIQPGQLINVQLPYLEMQGDYAVAEFTHSWNTGGLNTSLVLETQRDDLAQLFLERIKTEEGLRSSENINFMSYSVVFEFEAEGETDSDINTTRSNGNLILTAGSGTWTSITKNLDQECTIVELRVEGQDLASTTYQVSLDDGQNYTTVSLNTPTTVSPNGKKAKVKISMVSDTSNPNPIIEAVAIMAK